MTFRKILRYDPNWPKLRLFRVVWEGPELTRGGWPVSKKLAVALRPRLFEFRREFDAWRVVLLGVEVHRQDSHGGRFAA